MGGPVTEEAGRRGCPDRPTLAGGRCTRPLGLGGRSVLILVTAAVVLYLWLARTFHAMWVILGAAVGGQLLSALLKVVFARPRPDIVPHLTTVNFSSFPSGHSMSAAAVYLTLGLLLARFTIARGSESTSLP